MSQKYNSAKTSLNQIPATFLKVDSTELGWVSGTRNLDIGGGALFDNRHKFTDALLEKALLI